MELIHSQKERRDDTRLETDRADTLSETAKRSHTLSERSRIWHTGRKIYHLVPWIGMAPSVYFIDENTDLKDLQQKTKKFASSLFLFLVLWLWCYLADIEIPLAMFLKPPSVPSPKVSAPGPMMVTKWPFRPSNAILASSSTAWPPTASKIISNCAAAAHVKFCYRRKNK